MVNAAVRRIRRTENTAGMARRAARWRLFELADMGGARCDSDSVGECLSPPDQRGMSAFACDVGHPPTASPTATLADLLVRITRWRPR